MGVIGCRTDETDLDGVLEDTEGYENIRVFSQLKQYVAEQERCDGFLTTVDICSATSVHCKKSSSLAKRTMVTVSSSSVSALSILMIAVLSALAVAVHMIDTATKGAKGNPLKYDRRVIIVTDGRGQMDTGDLEMMVPKIKDTDAPFEIVLLGVDFDDPDVDYKEEDKEPQKVF
jgi:ATP-dependent DNA helicase 2 subunit 2